MKAIKRVLSSEGVKTFLFIVTACTAMAFLMGNFAACESDDSFCAFTGVPSK